MSSMNGSWDGAKPPQVLSAQGTESVALNPVGANGRVSEMGAAIRSRFREFFRNFRLDNVYPYRDALVRHWNQREYFIEVELAHLGQYDETLFNYIQVSLTYILSLSHV